MGDCALPEPHPFSQVCFLQQVHVSDPRGELIQSHLVNTASLAVSDYSSLSLSLARSKGFNKHDPITLNSIIILHLNRCSPACFIEAEMPQGSVPDTLVLLESGLDTGCSLSPRVRMMTDVSQMEFKGLGTDSTNP